MGHSTAGTWGADLLGRGTGISSAISGLGEVLLLQTACLCLQSTLPTPASGPELRGAVQPLAGFAVSPVHPAQPGKGPGTAPAGTVKVHGGKPLV